VRVLFVEQHGAGPKATKLARPKLKGTTARKVTR